MTDADRTLIFGDDGSPGSDVAWLWVNNHRWPGWNIDVVTATPPPMPPPLSEDDLEPLHEWEPPTPRRLFAEAGAARVRHLAQAVDPRILLDRQRDASLLVVGPRALPHLRAHLLGSTTEFLLHSPPTAMAVIRSATPTRRVVACVDGSAPARAALDAFLRLPWAPDCELVLLAVDDGATDVDAAFRDGEERAGVAGVTVTRHEARGRPRDVIAEELAELDPDLVVLGTRGLTGWQRLRVGSTANRVVRGGERNVLVASGDRT